MILKKILPFFYTLLLSGLLFGTDAAAQEKNSESIQKYIENFNKKTIAEHGEKLFLHIDRPAYFSGDMIWFKAYLLLAVTLEKDPVEKILYLEFSSLNDSLMITRAYQLDTGIVKGVFYLPDTIPSGQYRITAYTNWMKNDFAGNFFTRDIYIFNPEKITSAETDSSRVRKNKTNVAAPDFTAEKPAKKAPGKQISLKFYPEGGTFVNGLTNLVAFEALDDDNNPVTVKGKITDDLGNFITFFKTFKNGKGFFWIKPDKDRAYKALVEQPEEYSRSFDLPKTEQYGFVMHVINPFPEDSLVISIRAAMPGTNNHFYLLGIQDKIVKMAFQGNVRNKIYNIKIAKKLFKTGLVYFTLLDKNMIPKNERLVFINHFDDLNVDITLKEPVLKKRTLVEMSIAVKDKEGKPVSGDFSVAVTDAAIIPDSLYGDKNIAATLYLTSEFPEIKEDADKLLQKNEESHNQLDIVMLTKGWRKFVWEKVEDDFELHPEYKIEQGNWLKGKVTRKKNPDKPVPNVSLTAFLTGEFNDFYSTRTDKKGDFTLYLLDFSDTVNVVIQQKNRMDTKSNFSLSLKSNLPVFFDKPEKDQIQLVPEKNLPVAPPEPAKVSEKPVVLPQLHPSDKTALRYGSELEELQQDTASIMIDEVEISAERKKTPKEKITAAYGSPSNVVSDKQIEALIEKYPWRQSLFELIMDAIPGLYIDVNTLNIDSLSFSSRENDTVDITSEDLSLGIVDNIASDYGMYSVPKNLVKFFIKNISGRLLYIFVDGEYTASTDEMGRLSLMRFPYMVHDLIDMDAKSVKSIELILNVKDNPDKNLFEDYANLREDNPVILAIYTKDGNGILSDSGSKGLHNMKMLGFVREREFYSPNYSDTVVAPKETDQRVTLYWNPEVVLDADGMAELSFYNSDIAKSIRIELEGISSTGIPGNKTSVFGEVPQKVPGQSTQPQNRLSGEKPEMIFSPGIFNKNIWDKYLDTYEHEGMKMVIALNEKGEPVPFADILIKKSNFETTANASGIFAFDTEKIDKNDTVLISDEGNRFVSVSVNDIINSGGIVKVPSIKTEPENIHVKTLMNEVFKNNKRTKVKRMLFRGVYRETVKKDNFIYSLTDYSLDMEQYSALRSDLPHISHVIEGRRFRSANYYKAINFSPLNPLSDEIVQLRDPVMDDLYFIGSQYKKDISFRLEGSTVFRGREVYKISFTQKDNNVLNLFDGFLLVDKSDMKILYVYRKTSEVAGKFQTAAHYLENAGNFRDVKFIDNEYRDSYRKVNGEYVIKFEYFCVNLEADGTPISYSRAFEAFGNITESPKGREKLPLKDMKRRTLLVKDVKYDPSHWRYDYYLLPDFTMFSQAKYLNEVTIYNR